jgi:hypothetical protein
MTAGTSPTRTTSTGALGGGAETPTRTERVKAGIAAAGSTLSSAASSASEWRAVKTVRDSSIWSWLAWPFRAISSILGSIWSRVSKVVWGSPTPVSKEVKLVFPGYIWDSTVKTSPERAIRKGWLTIEKGVESKYFTLEQAQTNGWVPVTIVGRVYNSTMMLKTAVENGYMTVEKAIADGHITEAQAAKADWIQKK